MFLFPIKCNICSWVESTEKSGAPVCGRMCVCVRGCVFVAFTTLGWVRNEPSEAATCHICSDWTWHDMPGSYLLIRTNFFWLGLLAPVFHQWLECLESQAGSLCAGNSFLPMPARRQSVKQVKCTNKASVARKWNNGWFLLTVISDRFGSPLITSVIITFLVLGFPGVINLQTTVELLSAGSQQLNVCPRNQTPLSL